MSVQLEDGYTRIANAILENLSSAKLNGCQYAIILVILRFTYGFQRKEHDLSLTFIEKATGFDKRQVQRNLKLLEDSKIITQKVKSGVTRIISFNKDYETWTYGELTHGKKTVGEKAYGEKAYGENTVGVTADSPMVTYGESTYQERKVLKENLKDITDTTKPPEIILQDEFCRIHDKGEWTLKQSEFQNMLKITHMDIPLEFIINTMTKIHDFKKSKSEKVTSFNFYLDPIVDAWNAKNGGQASGGNSENTGSTKTKSRELEGWESLIVS